MTGCSAFEPLLLERSSGTIEAADAARLDAHLRTCSACRTGNAARYAPGRWPYSVPWSRCCARSSSRAATRR